MRRIGLAVVVAVSLLAVPLAAETQQARNVPRIGYLILSPLVDPPTAERQAFLDGLRDLGYVIGQNITIEYRSANWNRELLPDLAAELVDLKVAVIVTVGTAPLLAVGDATKTIPIVAPALLDPPSPARPRRNITGPWMGWSELTGKQLELLKETVPSLARVAVLWNPKNDLPRQLRQAETAARLLGVTLQSHGVNDPADMPPALSAMIRGRPSALLIFASPLTTAYRSIIIDFATKHRLPTMFSLKADVEAGGLMSYSASLTDIYRRLATYVDKILKGAKPGDLPVEQPTKFELVINLKTAKALGLTIPQSILVRADEIIQ